MSNTPDPWAETLAEAQSRFRAAAESRGWAWESHPLPGGSIDAAVWPGDPACGTRVVTGGVHGVESPLGVAACLTLLADDPRPAGRVVLIPVINPIGFALGRRVDGDNVDLNRNFLLEDEAFAGAPPFYASVDRVLNPPSLPPWLDDFLAHTFAATLRHGWRALKDAIAGGQYEFPRGLFFGGRESAPATRLLAEQWRNWVGPAFTSGGRVTHLDFHTGLGPWASYKLLLDPDTHPNLVERARHLGPVEQSESMGVSYAARGTFGPWARAHGGAADWLYVCAEFGTYPGLTMIRGLRRENRAHHFAPETEADRTAKRRLRELFLPASAAWRRRVLAEVRRLLARAG